MDSRAGWGLLLSLLATGSSSAQVPPSVPIGLVRGVAVMAESPCGQQAPSSPAAPCHATAELAADLPLSILRRDSGQVVASLRTDTQGRFSARLPGGHYLIRLGQPLMTLDFRAQEFEITAHRETTLRLLLHPLRP